MAHVHHTEPELVVLHTLRCCGAATTERIDAAVARLETVDVEGLLLDLAARGLVAHDGGAFGGWRLTDAGRDVDRERIAVELERVGARPEIRAAYDEFLPQWTLAVCGAWQVRSWAPMVLNDHTDRRYDAGVLGRLAAVDREVQPVCASLAARLRRFSGYGPRLSTALDRARIGELDQVTDSLDSYHAVWFQLHEDLLATLGISREAPSR